MSLQGIQYHLLEETIIEDIEQPLVEGDHSPTVRDLVNHNSPFYVSMEYSCLHKVHNKNRDVIFGGCVLAGIQYHLLEETIIEDIERVYPFVLCIHSFVQDLLSYNIGMSLRDTDAVGSPSKTLQKDFHRTNGRIPAAKRPPCPRAEIM